MPPKKKPHRREPKTGGGTLDDVVAAAAAAASEPVPPSEDLIFLFDSLRRAGDLPTLYAALKFVRERLRGRTGADRGYVVTAPEQDLLDQACLAVPYLMYKKAVDLLMRPRSMGGLAFSSAKADAIVRGIFEGVGIAALAGGPAVTEKRLARACPKLLPSASDARKILGKLAEVGEEARSKVAEFEARLDANAERTEIV
jgi:hypothetical protein